MIGKFIKSILGKKRLKAYLNDERLYRLDKEDEFKDYPFGRVPLATKEEYLKIWNIARNEEYPIIDNIEKELGYAIEKEWLDNLALITQCTKKTSKIIYQHGRLLYAYLRSYLEKNKDISSVNVFETGTARGFSALCMAKALEDHNRHGKIITCDILPHEIPMYWNCIADHEGPQTRQDLLVDYLDLITKYIMFFNGDTRMNIDRINWSRIHFAFLDGGHEYKDVMMEFDYLKHRQNPGDMIFFDDYSIDQFPGIVKAVDEIVSINKYQKRIIHGNEQRTYVHAMKL
ncbi:MAG: class I SAM-dependent methyltransferase [Cyclobacteriaceae bacterium]|nr:class I SAM-dependent methyltransferase [Cyclobacteriaceae bacterium SS2]